ncbi:TonB family protein [Chitinibacter bivalviorum]|uniref:TonB family protein n=1 Tax=Chitinibacter bivalviorum TaxID=2739434 RepID=A0A7H9BL22_9NEIS|nr:TonB family protein [Chitinibacter bivalviorum]QLG89092.1 TonB family protein [Chitinibacter bivalviorum]
MDRRQRFMMTAMVLSLIAHAFPIFGIKLVLPNPRQLLSQQPIDVVLVNQKTTTKPKNAEVEAQADLDGGGNTDAPDHRVKSPLPSKSKKTEPELEQVEAKLKKLEDQSAQMMTQLKSSTKLPSDAKNVPDKPEAKTLDLEELKEQARREQEIAGLAAQIAKQNHEYQSKPRKAFVGARAKQTSVAMYMDGWRQRIEKVGTMAYPVDATGNKIYGQLRVTVEIGADGTMLSSTIDKTSGNPQLDAAALRILKMSAPFSKLPNDLLDSTGKPATVLVITRTWTFERQTLTSD